MKALGKAFDLKAAAAAFGEAFDPKGCIAAFREAFDLRDAAQSFTAGFRDGASLLSRHLRKVGDTLHVAERHVKEVKGHSQLERLLADVASESSAAAGALNGFRSLLRRVHSVADTIPDEGLLDLAALIIRNGPAARPEDFTGAVAQALAEGQAKAAEFAFAEAELVLDAALYRAAAEREALLAERRRIGDLHKLISIEMAKAQGREGERLLLQDATEVASTKRRGRRRGPE